MQQSDLTDRLERVFDTAGLLFQPHPGYDGWRTTRPGFRPGEIAAFLHDAEGLRKSFISVVFHAEGEVDEDGIEWPNDCYEIIVSERDGTSATRVADDREEAAEIVADEMERIAQH